MIIQELTDNLYHTYSNRGVLIHGGFPEGDYAEAYDPVQRTYTETDIPIEEQAQPEELLEIIMGGEV